MVKVENDFYDAIIVGGGPAGLSSAIYMARAKYKTLVIEKEKFGGQITITSEVVNYPGVFHTSGEKLTKEMQKQAEAFGAEFMLADVRSIEKTQKYYTIKTDKGEFKTLGVILATGASPRSVGFEGEEEFKGRGVAYCATCDGEFFTGKPVFVVGSGFAACEESIFLTRFASEVQILVRGDAFTCTGSVVNEVVKHDKIKVLYNTTVKKVSGNTILQEIVLDNNGCEEVFSSEEGLGVFVFVGYAPASGNFSNLIEVNDQGYIITDEHGKTSADGIYAAGDICIKQLRQVVTAVSDGATAATSLEKYVAEQYDKYDLPRREYKAKAVRHEVEKKENNSDSFISEDIIQELLPVFDRFESKVVLRYKLDDKPISREVEGFMNELSKITDKLICKKDDELESNELPCIAICDTDGNYRGVSFHGVPGGHEFNSFVIGLYNAAGPGQRILEEDLKKIKSIDKKLHIDLAVTLSCTNCPELVMAAERIALENENISLDIYDLSQYEELKQKYSIMSVPCMIVNEADIHFGKKNIAELLNILVN